MDYIQEQYRPLPLAANSTTSNLSIGTGGFLCITSGTLTIAKNNAAQTVVIAAMPVTAGTYIPMPFVISELGMIITTAGGASGVLAIK